jgi:hypothetical protein
LKKKRQFYFFRWSKKLNPKQLGLALHTPALCSCYMCGNPRKYDGERTVQEKRWMQEVVQG